MAQSDPTLAKLTELKQRIEFLRNDVEPDILVGAIERELQQLCNFTYKFELVDKNHIYILYLPELCKPIQMVTDTKLESLYGSLRWLLREIT